MFTIQGKYNVASIMIDSIDETTYAQVLSFLNHPAFAENHIAIMPDCHAGKGAVIGFTMPITDYVIPNVIGVDIGCGMLTWQLNVKASDISLKDLDTYIHERIPSGFSVRSKALPISSLTHHVIETTCSSIGIDSDRAFKSIGTLGGGNHFIEVGEYQDNLYITIHSGSRNFGKCIADFYQKKAVEDSKSYFVDMVGAGQKGLEALHVNSINGIAYLKATAIAQEYARLNRAFMMRDIVDYLNCQVVDTVESVHNFISADNIIRKGATSAQLGQRVIIPFNMRDGIALCVGKGNSDYNCSAPHGAGRILSRSKAKEQLSVDTFKNQMVTAGVYTTTAGKSTLDEAPDAYKDMNVILDNIKDTVEVQALIKPIYNFKAGGD